MYVGWSIGAFEQRRRTKVFRVLYEALTVDIGCSQVWRRVGDSHARSPVLDSQELCLCLLRFPDTNVVICEYFLYVLRSFSGEETRTFHAFWW